MDAFEAQCLIQLNGKRYSMEIECLESNYYRSYDPNPHLHPSYHLILISKGGNNAEIGGAPPIEIALNSLLFINPLIPHRFEVPQGGEVEHTSLIWRFRDEDGAYALFPLQRLRGIPDAKAEPYKLRQLSPAEVAVFIRKHREAKESRFKDLDAKFHFSTLCFELFFLGLDLISQGDGEALPQNPRRQIAAKVKAIVEREMVHASLDIPSIAAQIGMHPNYVNSVFAQVEGETINHYIRDRRIELAKSIMLSDPQRPLADVARLCGFSQHSYFTRTFRKLCGINPSEFRQFGDGLSFPGEESY